MVSAGITSPSYSKRRSGAVRHDARRSMLRCKRDRFALLVDQPVNSVARLSPTSLLANSFPLRLSV